MTKNEIIREFAINSLLQLEKDGKLNSPETRQLVEQLLENDMSKHSKRFSIWGIVLFPLHILGKIAHMLVYTCIRDFAGHGPRIKHHRKGH